MTTLPAALSTTAPAPRGDVSALFGRFVSYLDASPKTVATYTHAIRQFGNWLSERGISSPVREDVIAYRDAMAAKHRPGTARCYLVAVKLFFRWASLEGLYPNVSDNVRGVKVDNTPKRAALTSRQAHALLEAARPADGSEQELRDYAILALLLSCGLRGIEAVRANIRDLRPLGDQTVLYVQGKGHIEADTFVRIPAQVEDAIRAYLVARGRVASTAPLFASTSNNNRGGRLTTATLSRMVKGMLRSIGLDSEYYCMHGLRHSAITLALVQGMTLQEASEYARHSNISTTQIYAHNLERSRNRCAHAVAAAIF